MLFSEEKVGREEEEQLGTQERKQTPTTITTEEGNSRNWRRKSQPKRADSPGSLVTWVTCLWIPREASVSPLPTSRRDYCTCSQMEQSCCQIHAKFRFSGKMSSRLKSITDATSLDINSQPSSDIKRVLSFSLKF